MVQKTPTALMAPLENLKGFATTRPPCILFMVCLGIISVILMTLAFIIKDNELKKPDVSQVCYFMSFISGSSYQYCAYIYI